MIDNLKSQITHLLNDIKEGDKSKANELLPLVYEQFRSLANNYFRRENKGHTLQPTELVHEAYMKLVDQDRVDWKGKTHFFAVGAQAMRRILVDHARSKNRIKRGSGVPKLSLDEELTISTEREDDLIFLDDALIRLEQIDERQAKIVELRFFGGLNVAETAEELGLSKRTIEKEWTMIKAWLRKEISEGD